MTLDAILTPVAKDAVMGQSKVLVLDLRNILFRWITVIHDYAIL